MAYRHVTEEERRHIYEWKRDGYRIQKIGKLLSRHGSTISREIRRNKGECGYRPKQVNEKAVEGAQRKGPRTFTEEMRIEIEKRIRLGETPEMIHGRTHFEGRPMICKESIYKYIYICRCQERWQFVGMFATS